MTRFSLRSGVLGGLSVALTVCFGFVVLAAFDTLRHESPFMALGTIFLYLPFMMLVYSPGVLIGIAPLCAIAFCASGMIGPRLSLVGRTKVFAEIGIGIGAAFIAFQCTTFVMRTVAVQQPPRPPTPLPTYADSADRERYEEASAAYGRAYEARHLRQPR